MYKILVTKPEGRISLHLDRIDGRIMLKWILRERCVKMQTALTWDWSQALANMIITLCIKKQAGIFFTSCAPYN
jgi:hypothetical protein